MPWAWLKTGLFFCLVSARAIGASESDLDFSQLKKIEVQPTELTFHSSREKATLLVTGFLEGGHVVDLTADAQLVSSQDEIVAADRAEINPLRNGNAEVKVQVANHEIIVPVVVTGNDRPAPISFRTETVAALTRQGCNSGGCHGSPSGKGGFLLSLQAYDHAMDERSLIRDAQGRRTNSIDPDKSLLLLKPTMTVKHGGGLQLHHTDYAYSILEKWIAEGIHVDSPEGKRCVRLELLPSSARVLREPHLHQQLVAWAHFEDGTRRDVTRLTKFSSSDNDIATVTAAGRLQGLKRGQVAVMARYLDHLVSSQFTMVEEIEGFEWKGPPANNYVDELVYEKLHQLQYLPSDLCSDNDFVRRVYLDVLGNLPTVEELNAFLTDPAPDRRNRLIDDLLDRPEYAKFWALKWGDLLRLNKKNISQSGVYKFHQWLIEAFEQNMPFDQFVRELLTAQGSTYDHPAANYYRAVDTMLEATETTAQLFLGSRIQCAKCHNHPFENWTQNNYYGLNAFFNRVQRKPGFRSEEQVVYVAREGEVRQPRTGQTMKPWLPGKGEVELPSSQDRRKEFADWLTGPKNPFFAKVAVNRIWSEIMGQGIVEPVDDFRQSNPPANPALLAKLAEEFQSQGYDQKELLRTLLRSRTYQLSSEVNPFNKDDQRLFSHARMRMLSAEQLLDAICQVTQVDETYPGLPAGTRAVEIPSPDFNHAFLDTFGRPARTTACACERSDDSTLAQAIQLFNGSLIHQKISNKGNRFHRMLAEEKSPEVVVKQLYLAAYSRPPTEGELQTALEHVGSKETSAEGVEDICWALFNSDEFLSQH